MIKLRMAPILSRVALTVPLIFGSWQAVALDDVLNTPAMQSDLIAESLLLEVVKAGDRLVAVGERGHIIFSDDEGRTWEQGKVPVSTLLTAVHFPTPTHGWVVGHGGVVLHSADGGKTWVKQFDGNLANEMVIKQAQDNYAELEAALETAPEEEAADLEYQLEELGFAVEDAEIDAETGPSKPLLDVWFKNDKEGFVVGAYGFFFHTKDGGQNWSNYAPNIDNQDRFHLNAIGEVTGGALFIAGEAGLIFRSLDQGETWESVESPYDGSLFGLNGTGNVNEVLVYGLRGHIFRSVDLGDTWKAVDTDSEATLMDGAFTDEGRVTLVGNAGVVMVSSDAGETFRATTREDRLSLVSVIPVSNADLVIVGESGVVLADPNGRNR